MEVGTYIGNSKGARNVLKEGPQSMRCLNAFI
jgi:hypothetical protein